MPVTSCDAVHLKKRGTKIWQMMWQALSARPYRGRQCTSCRGCAPRHPHRRLPRACTRPPPPGSPALPRPPPSRDNTLRGTRSREPGLGRLGEQLQGLLVLFPRAMNTSQHIHSVRVPLPCRLLQKRRALLRVALAPAKKLNGRQVVKASTRRSLVSEREKCGAKCKPYVRPRRYADRHAQRRPCRPCRFIQQPAAQAPLRLPIPVARSLFHGLESERSKQPSGIFRLSGPIAVRIHVQVRESGGSPRGSCSSSGSRGSCGCYGACGPRAPRDSRLSRRALGGIALGFATFLPGRHCEI